MNGVEAAAREVLRATDAVTDASNGKGHAGEDHDRWLHFDPCTGDPEVHIYSTSADCAACGGAQYGSEYDLQVAIVRLRLALGEPLHPWEESYREHASEAIR